MLGEVLAKALELALPARAPRADPLLDRPQRRRLDPAGPHTPDLVGADEAARLEHVKVLYHRRQRHRQRLGELADRCRSVAQPLDDRPSMRIRQRVKDPIDVVSSGPTLKHLLNYTRVTRAKYGGAR